MNNWTNDFLTRCLEGVPKGNYRNRAEKELQDHLLALSQDLEQSGYTPEEARNMAQSRMGDPAELARNYMREWKRRNRWSWLFILEIVLFDLCISIVGLLYIANERNFGKAWVSYWGIVAIIAAQFMTQSSYRIFNKTWTVTGWSCIVLAVIQVPPILCWMVFGGPFEMSGMMVPGWAGLSVHVLFFLWSLANHELVARFQREENASQTVQSA